MSRKVIKRKNEMICKTYVSHLCSHVTRTGPSTLQSAGSLPLELDIVAKTGKIQTGEERRVEVEMFLYAKMNYSLLISPILAKQN